MAIGPGRDCIHPQAKKLLVDKDTTPGLRRTMVKTAVILGFPVQG